MRNFAFQFQCVSKATKDDIMNISFNKKNNDAVRYSYSWLRQNIYPNVEKGKVLKNV